MKVQWAFTDALNASVFTTRDVIEEGKPILLGTHDQDDGAWQFRTGKTVPPPEGEIAALDEIIFRDHSVVELADLPLGWSAMRASMKWPWKRQPILSST